MSQKVQHKQLLEEVVMAKDMHERKFQYLSDNFYIMRAALRYLGVKQGKSITASRVAENFPISIPVAGSCLSILCELEVIEQRTESGSPKRYMPQKLELDRMEEVRQILLKNREIETFMD